MQYGLRKTLSNCANKAGVTVLSVERRSKHYRILVLGNRIGVITVSATPSDTRAFKNVIMNMKKVGYV